LFRSLVLVLTLVCGLAQAGTTLHLDPQATVKSLAGHMDWLTDASTGKSLSEVQSSTQWLALEGSFRPGFSPAALWLRLQVEQPVAGVQEWILEIDNVQLDEARLFAQSATGQWQDQRAGGLVDSALWPIQGRTPSFRLQLDQGTHTVYLRLKGEHSLSSELRLWPADQYHAHASDVALIFGGYFGIFAAVMLMQFFFWRMVRDAASGWYLLYTASVMGAMVLTSGYIQNVFGLSTAAMGSVRGVYLCLVPAAMARLTVVWLDLAQRAPNLSRIYQTVVYASSVCASLLVLAGYFRAGVQSSQALSLLWIIVSMAVAVWLWRRHEGHAGFYLLVFGFVDIGILVRFLRNLGVLPVNLFTDYGLVVGITLHLLAMSLYFIYRYNALNDALRLAQRAREEQRDFVGMVSHEFRTPLAIISTSAQQLSANLSAPVERTLQRCTNIRNATLRLGQLLDDYLSMDRMDSASQPLQTRACDFFEVIEEAVLDWPIDRIRLEIRDLPQPWVGDPDLMRIVLRNLLANADRHSPADKPISLIAQGAPNGTLEIRVRDDGDGIAVDELPRLFQKFFRGRASQGSPGAGLGLYLVQRIIQLHRGTVGVQSQVGSGTTFTIVLPRA